MLQRLHPFGQFGWNARRLAAVDVGLLDPVIQPMRPAADLRGDRYDGLQARLGLAFAVQYQSHGAVAHFGENLFVVLLMMFHPTQELDPQANPAQLTPLGAVTR